MKGEVWETIRGVMMKRSPSTVEKETQSESLGLWRPRSDETNPHNAVIENTRENRRRTKQTDGKSGSKKQLKKVTF